MNKKVRKYMYIGTIVVNEIACTQKVMSQVFVCLSDSIYHLSYLMLLEQASNPNTNPIAEKSHLHTAAN